MRNKTLLVCILLLTFSISGCFNQKKEVDQELESLMQQTIPDIPNDPTNTNINQQKISDINVVLPITDELSYIGNPFLAGMEKALDEVNKKGGINGEKVNLIKEDIVCDNSTNIKEFERKFSAKGSQIIIMGGCNKYIRELANYNNKEKVISLLAFPNNINNKDYQYVFNLLPSFDVFTKDFANYFIGEEKDTKKIKSLSLIIDENIKENDINSFENILSENNGIIVDKEVINSESLNIAFSDSFLTKNPDGILISVEKPALASKIIKLLENKKIEIPVIIKSELLSQTYETKLNIIQYSPNIKEDYKVDIPKDFKGYESYYLSGYDSIIMTVRILNIVGNNSEAIRGFLLGMEIGGQSFDTIKYNISRDIENFNFKFEPFVQNIDDDELISIELEEKAGITDSSREKNILTTEQDMTSIDIVPGGEIMTSIGTIPEGEIIPSSEILPPQELVQ